jgi:Bacterial protein of unknown function (HtrL_YibB)
MSNPVTIVTAFFDINRAEKGDGRTIEEYKQWIIHTLQLNCNLYIVTEEKFRSFFMENRPLQYQNQTFIEVIDFKDCHYYKYYDKMVEILNSPQYKSRIAHPNRVECKLPEYNIIQYSKFHFLQMAIEQNPFHSEYFLWMDAGCSRFFLDVDISKSYPSEQGIAALSKNKDMFIIQRRHDLDRFPIDEHFVWRADNLLSGGMFGGTAWSIQTIADHVETVFQEKMLSQNNVNNEQLALAVVWKDNPYLFCTTNNQPGQHLMLFKLLA